MSNKKDILSSEGITVLSLFDGISCGHIALDKANHRSEKDNKEQAIYLAMQKDRNEF